MSKSWNLYKRPLVVLLMLWGAIPVLVFGQVRPENHRLLDIQQSYERGEIRADAAVLEQFQVLYEPTSSQKTIHKCATPAFMFLHAHKAQFSAQTLAKIDSYNSDVPTMQGAAPQLSYVSPSGKFEILYDTTGVDSVSVMDEDGNNVADYIDRVAFAADSSYRHEVKTIGFSDPIPAGSTYKIYVEEITFGAYGYTESTTGTGALTEIYIENDFDGFPPNSHPEGEQIGSIYATIAHEFKHAIQYRQNLWKTPSGGFDWSEMDATLMEEVVFDNVNDYYNYIKKGFDSPKPYSSSIFYAPQNGTPGSYWHVTWMIFYSELYGNEVWKKAWDEIEAQNGMSIDEALKVVLPDFGDTFTTSFVRNHLWHFASGTRAGDDDYGFGEKHSYPYANLDSSFAKVPLTGTDISYIKPLAARYFEVTPASNDDGYIDVAVDFDSTQVGIGLLLYLKTGSMEEVIATGEDKSQVYMPTDVRWGEVSKVGVVVANYAHSTSSRNLRLRFGKTGNSITIRDPEYADLPKQIKVYQNYPNPFNPETNISFDLPRSAFVKLDVFDITGRYVRTVTNQFYRLGSYSLSFSSEGLSSGVYLYRLKINDQVFTKKMTLIK